MGFRAEGSCPKRRGVGRKVLGGVESCKCIQGPDSLKAAKASARTMTRKLRLSRFELFPKP